MDTYLNDSRFVGVENFGPLPEGTYRFSVPAIQRFTLDEQLRLLVTWHESTVQTASGPVSGGDWGSGRVALQPVGRLREGRFGHANTRTGFYLHGGIMSGSSGCIDIGSHFSDLADWLQGFSRSVTITVRYEHPPPSVGVFTGFSGMLAYQRAGFAQHPSLRLGAEFGPRGDARFLTSTTYDVILNWAGGSLSAGARLDVALNDREAFVRAGLGVDAHFRLFRGLYGQLSAGYLWPVAGGATGGAEVGVGLQYDFGRVQLEVLYDILAPASSDSRIQQVLLGLGVRY